MVFSGLTDPNKYLIVYVLGLLVVVHPVISLATIGTLLLLTALAPSRTLPAHTARTRGGQNQPGVDGSTHDHSHSRRTG
jgi:hypothetical protein